MNCLVPEEKIKGKIKILALCYGLVAVLFILIGGFFSISGYIESIGEEDHDHSSCYRVIGCGLAEALSRIMIYVGLGFFIYGSIMLIFAYFIWKRKLVAFYLGLFSNLLLSAISGPLIPPSIFPLFLVVVTFYFIFIDKQTRKIFAVGKTVGFKASVAFYLLLGVYFLYTAITFGNRDWFNFAPFPQSEVLRMLILDRPITFEEEDRIVSSVFIASGVLALILSFALWKKNKIAKYLCCLFAFLLLFNFHHLLIAVGAAITLYFLCFDEETKKTVT